LSYGRNRAAKYTEFWADVKGLARWTFRGFALADLSAERRAKAQRRLGEG